MKKSISVFLAVLLVVSLTSMFAGIIKPTAFWVVTALIAIAAYWILPKI